MIMQPSNLDLLGHVRDHQARRPTQRSQQAATVSRSLSGIRRLRSDGKSTVQRKASIVQILLHTQISAAILHQRRFLCMLSWRSYTHSTITQNPGSRSRRNPHHLPFPPRLPTTVCPKASGGNTGPVFGVGVAYIDPSIQTY